MEKENTQELSNNEKEDIETIKQFVDNEENRSKAIDLASQIKKELRNWFTLNDFIKKFKLEEDDAIKRLRILGLFKLCVGRENKYKFAEFKITLTDDDRLLVLQAELEQLKIREQMILNDITIIRNKPIKAGTNIN